MKEIASFFHKSLEKDNLAQEYLMLRNITVDSINRFNIGYWPIEGDNGCFCKVIANSNLDKKHLFLKNMNSDAFPCSISIPIYKDGEIFSMYFRAIDPYINRKHHYIPGIEKYLWNEAAIYNSIDFKKPLILCEGIFDSISLEQLGYDSIALLSASITSSALDKILSLKDELQLIIMFDNDEKSQTGQTKSLELYKLLLSHGCDVKIAYLDSHSGKNDVNSMCCSGKSDKIVKSINNAVMPDVKIEKIDEIERKKNHFIYDKFSSVDIDTVNNYPLTQLIYELSGANLSYGVNKIRCPFPDHSDSTPSFIIKNNRYVCYGCGKRGDVIQFLIDYKNLSFVEAINYLEGAMKNVGNSLF